MTWPVVECADFLQEMQSWPEHATTVGELILQQEFEACACMRDTTVGLLKPLSAYFQS